MFQKTAFVLTFLLSATLNAEVYKWVDKDGNVHYTDKPPAGGQSIQLNVKTGKSKTPAKDLNTQVEELDEQEEVERIRKQQEQDFAKAEAEKNDYCKQLNDNLKTLQTTTRIRVTGDDGELRFMTPEEIVKRKKDTQQKIAKDCTK